MAAELFGQANAEFVAENYVRALELYTDAIKSDSTKDEYYVNRAHVNIKLENYKDAVSDADQAITLSPKNNKAYLRKGTALFSLKEYKSAIEEFKQGARLDESDNNFKGWIQKCEFEMDSKTSSKEKDPGQNCELNGDGKEQTCAKSAQDTKPESTTNTETTATSSPDKAPAAPNVRHDWYQTQSHVIVAVMLKNVKKEDLSVNIEKNLLCITVKLASNREYQLDVNLAHTVVPEQCQIKLLATKIEVKLKKSEGIQWSTLESSGEQSNIKQINVGSSMGDTVPKYPTSSQHSKDWDKLAQNIAKEEKDEKLEGDAALNQLFQQIYADGSDEVKKAMMKSFYESGGTVLSTNWNEIGAQNTEVKPPDGMEYKKWDS